MKSHPSPVRPDQGGFALLAMLALERTHTPVAAKVVAGLGDLDGTMLYLASRCLLSQDEPAGLPGLLRALEAVEDASAAPDPIAALALGKEIRRTLALLSRMPIDTPLQDWQRWAQGVGPLHCPPLPEPVLTYEEPLPPSPGR